MMVERTRLGAPVMVREEAVGGYCARGATRCPYWHWPGKQLGPGSR